mgnify:CR=1 FL=1
MIKNLKKINMFFLLLFFSSSCNTYYGVHGTLYTNKEKTIQEGLQLYEKYDLTEIFPLKSPIEKNVLVVIPSHEPIDGNSVNAMGYGGKLCKVSLSQEKIDFINTVSRERYEFVYKAIKKKNLFKKITIISNDSPENTLYDDYDFLIYYRRPIVDVLAGWTISNVGNSLIAAPGPLPGWYIKSKSWLESRPIDTAYYQPVYRAINIWLKSLEELARGPVPIDKKLY